MICNPINVNYRYQFNKDPRKKQLSICREAADPSMIEYHGKYYIFASMNLSVWVSTDLKTWESHKLPSNLPLYDYAPDVRVLDDYVYFSASSHDKKCDYYRTKDVINGPYERIKGTFDFWDPNLFIDDDNRVYFYWGCSSETPIYGVELDPKTMKPIGKKKELIYGNPCKYGFERVGDNNSIMPASEEEIEEAMKAFFKKNKVPRFLLPKKYVPMIRGMFSKKPYIEGAWMDKHNGKYYLQYAFAGTQYNTYGDGVYVGDSPLGPFELATNNPYSYKPGGFINGAGHGSTMRDLQGRLWHTSTMRISINHDFERRVGIWPAMFDEDGELVCNQRYGDWPHIYPDGEFDIFKKPDYMLLSYNKKVKASSCLDGFSEANVVDEDVRTLWKAKTNSKDEYIEIDLGKEYSVNAIQINFADIDIDIDVPGKIRGTTQARYIEERDLHTRYLLSGSIDGENYFTISDKREVDTDLSHDFIELSDGTKVRYIRVSEMTVPYDQNPTLSGVRVFGTCEGDIPSNIDFTADRVSPVDMDVKIFAENAIGYNVLWGHAENKLYHSYLTYDSEIKIPALVDGRDYYVKVEAFNECGIAESKSVFVKAF